MPFATYTAAEGNVNVPVELYKEIEVLKSRRAEVEVGLL